MKSHVCEFRPGDLLRLAGWPLVPVVLFALAMQAGVRLNLVPTPRPTLDTERTILIHQAESARQQHDAEILLLGDSSCLMDVSARRLGEEAGRPALSLATFSYLDLNAHASMLREYAQSNPGRLRAVVLLMHPESLRRLGSEAYYSTVLTNFWNAQDSGQVETLSGRAMSALGLDMFKGRILARAMPLPLNGAYGQRYGFTRELEDYLTREHGSAIDPDPPQKFTGTAEYRLAPALERASRDFRKAVPSGAKLLVGITPVPEGFAGARYPAQRAELLRRWNEWLQADAILNELPAVLPDEAFVRTTHLKESAVPHYTAQVAVAVKALLSKP
jgi:hypothetical protein